MSCPYCNLYKSAARRLQSELREVEDALRSDDFAQQLVRVTQERNRYRAEVDALKIERGTDWKLSALQEAADTLGYGKGNMPTKSQWDMAKGVGTMVMGVIEEYRDRLPEDFYAVMVRLLEG